MNDPIPTAKIVIAGLVVLFVALAMGQIVLFDLNKDTRKNLLLHKVIACLGMGAAFYALFIAHFHFSGIGWMGLAGSVIGILFVGSMIKKYKKKKPRPSPEKKSPPTEKKRSEKAEPQGKRKGKPPSGRKRMEVLLALFWALLFIGMLLWFFLGE